MTFPKKPLELFTFAPAQLSTAQWLDILTSSYCQYLGKKCDKVRKSEPNISIGTCTVGYQRSPVVICPHRFLQHRQIFLDTLHLLRHDPGDQQYVVPEVTIPGGSVDYFVVSMRQGEIKDYLALEIQTLDTTGSVWPARQKFISDDLGIPVEQPAPDKNYTINWKMTAKTILIQMHHKVETLELLGKKLILVIQDVFFDYMTREFATVALNDAEIPHAAHFHVYALSRASSGAFSIELTARYSTTAAGIEQMLGLKADKNLSENDLISCLKRKISERTLLTI